MLQRNRTGSGIKTDCVLAARSTFPTTCCESFERLLRIKTKNSHSLIASMIAAP